MSANGRPQVAWFPKMSDLSGNPYWERLQQALKETGVMFATDHHSYWMNRSWLWRNRNRVGVLHFHFLQPFYESPDGRASRRRLLKFSGDLLLARLLRYRLVWTVHDLMPTWPKEPEWVERLARRIMCWLADAVIVHCEEARHQVSVQFGCRGDIQVVPHPSYASAYPNEVTQEKARTMLEIATKNFVVGFVGGIRPNKGIEQLIEAFANFKKPEATLLIAGRPWHPQTYVDELRTRAARDQRIRIQAVTIPDEEMQYYINACNVLVFPFRQVLTSGSAVLAMSFCRPIIVPYLGCLPELVESGAGYVYKPGDVADLAAAIWKAAAADLSAMGSVAAQQANAYSWRDLALDTLKVYGEH